MPKAKEDRRKREVPNFMIDRSTGKQFKWLSPEEKQRVWSAFMAWEDEACKRGAITSLPDVDGLSEKESDTLHCMCRDAQDGIDSYWNKYSHTTDGQATVERRTTDEQPNKRIKERMKEETNERAEAPAHIDVFVPPSIEEVRRYAQENGLNDDAEAFVTYYTARDWKHKDGQSLTNFEALYRLWIFRGEQFKEKERASKVVPANNYHQRDYSGDEMEKLLGVDELYRQ